MYSPSSSPRKGPFGSNKSSPRKPLLSPSSAEITPFSYSSDGLNLFGNELLSKTNGIIPMSISMDRRVGNEEGSSLPRTPVTSSSSNISGSIRPRTQSWIPLGKSHSVGSGGVTGLFSSGSAGGYGSNPVSSLPGKTMKEYDDSLRDLKRENFNLKLRIYFLEERMGQGGCNITSDKMEDVLELKMACESLKYDVHEKTELLHEARIAIEDLEARLNAVSRERNQEKRCLEDKLCQLEEDLQEAQLVPNPIHLFQLDSPSSGASSILNSPISRKNEEVNGDSDDSLLREVEIEMKRKVPYEGYSPLAVVMENEEKEAVAGRLQDLEEDVERLTKIVKETEKCLIDAQSDVARRVTQITELGNLLQERDEEIHKLKESDEAKEILIKNIKEKRDATEERLMKAKTDLESKVSKYEKGLRNKEEILQELCKEVEVKNKQIRDLQSNQGSRSLMRLESDLNFVSINEESDNDKDLGLTTCVVTPAIKSTIQPPVNAWGLEIVTQNLHIPPTLHISISTEEANKLRKNVRKLKDDLKLVAQEKKELIHKVDELSKKITSTEAYRMSKPIEIVDVSSQTYDVSKFTVDEKESLRLCLVSAEDSLGASNMDELRIASDTRGIAKLIPIERRERQDSEDYASSGWNNGLPDPSLCLPDFELDEEGGFNAQELYSYEDLRNCSNYYRVLKDEDYKSKHSDFLVPSLEYEEDVLVPRERPKNLPTIDSTLGPRSEPPFDMAQSEDGDCWSQPDVNEARNRMGISSRVLTGQGEGKSNLEKTSITSGQKSFYALEYTAQDFTNTYKEDTTNYSEILDGTDNADEASTFSTEECIEGSCVKGSLGRMKYVMDCLSYEIDLSNEIDSGVTEDSFDGRFYDEFDDSAFFICTSCSKTFLKDLQGNLLRANTLLKLSAKTVKRFRHLIREYELRSQMSMEELNFKTNRVAELESSLLDLRNETEENESKLRCKLEFRQKELEIKAKENQNLENKLNENYKLVAQLSSENLKLSGDKIRLEEAMNNKNAELSDLRKTLLQSEKILHSLKGAGPSDKSRHWNISSKENGFIQSDPRSSPETSSSFDFFPEKNGNLNEFSKPRPGNNNIPMPDTPPPVRIGRFGSRPNLQNRRRFHQNKNSSSRSTPDDFRQAKNKELNKFKGDKSGMSDISSPDLGVDLGSSDPFSSLERRCLPGSDAMNNLLQENNQLRREKETLSDQLNRSKSVMKDYVARLNCQQTNLNKEMFNHQFSNPLVRIRNAEAKSSSSKT